MITVGCPVNRREWIIDRWFDAIENAIDDEITYVFVGDLNTDPTFDVIERKCAEYKRGSVCTHVYESRINDLRVWDSARHERLAELRNLVLLSVRGLQPEYHLSIDSDILLHPDAYKLMRDSLKPEWAAIGSKTYLEPFFNQITNYCMINKHGNMLREDASGCFEVDVIMALKLMTPVAYGIDYVPDVMGEDIGYARNCKAAGLRFGWTGAVASKHVMSPDRLDKVDPRCGY